MPGNKQVINPSMVVIASIVVILATATTIIAISIQSDEITTYLRENDIIPLLFFISDEENLVSAQLIFINANTKTMAVFDVPRKLGAIIPTLGRVDRVDNLYKELGPAKTRDILEVIFDTRIDFFLDPDISDIEVIVDLIEGITVFLATPIENELNGRPVLIPGGNVLLDGEKTSDFILYEGSEERDLEWTSRRWSFVRELFRAIREYQLAEPDNLNRFAQHIEASFNKDAIRTFIGLLSDLALDDMLTQRILGTEREVESDEKSEPILFPHFEGQLVRDSIKQIVQILGNQEDNYSGALSSRLEILNGTETNGLAARTRDLYQNFGFEVVRIGNAGSNDYEQTLIIDRSNNLGDAEQVGKIIQGNNIAEGTPLVDYPEIDITIILGSDFDGWYVQSSREE